VVKGKLGAEKLVATGASKLNRDVEHPTNSPTVTAKEWSVPRPFAD